MSNSDGRLLHMYRVPTYQRRLAGLANYASVPHARTPSPNMSHPIFRRRHSTPTVSAVNFIEGKFHPSNRIVKRLYPNTRPTRLTREQVPNSETVKAPTRPVSLVKPRYQDERTGRIATTPTNPTASMEVMLPVAKRNRGNILETPSPIRAEIPLMNRKVSLKKRDRAVSLDLENDGHVLHSEALGEHSSKSPSIKWCHRKCLCRFSHYNLCYWYFKCPFFCWIACLLSLLGVLIGVLIIMGLLSRTQSSADASELFQGNITQHERLKNASLQFNHNLSLREQT